MLHYIPDDRNLHLHNYKYLKPHIQSFLEKIRNAYINVVKAFAKCQLKATKELGYHYDRDAQIPGDRSPSD